MDEVENAAVLLDAARLAAQQKSACSGLCVIGSSCTFFTSTRASEPPCTLRVIRVLRPEAECRMRMKGLGSTATCSGAGGSPAFCAP
jgi:hypothetical protein